MAASTQPRSPEIKEVNPTTIGPNLKPAPTVVGHHRRGCQGGFSIRNLLLLNSGANCIATSSIVGEIQLPSKGKKLAVVEGVPAKCLGKKNVEGISWGTKMVIGERYTMEDYSTNVRGLRKISCREFGGCSAPESDHAIKNVPLHYFGVFDGHRGHQVSEYCANVLHEMVAEEWEKQGRTDAVGWREKWKISLCRAFERADETFRSRTLEVGFAGSTATVVIVSPCQIIASNCGDSKAILCRNKRVVPLTFDHKPQRKEEADRIESVGGRIMRVNGLRVEGVLAMTRAIGDHDLKPYVISTPEVSYTKRSEEDECLVVATDGLWDVMSVEMVAKFARDKLRTYRSIVSSGLTPAAAVAEDLVHKAMSCRTKDNIAVTVVDLKPLSTTKRCH